MFDSLRLWQDILHIKTNPRKGINDYTAYKVVVPTAMRPMLLRRLMTHSSADTPATSRQKKECGKGIGGQQCIKTSSIMWTSVQCVRRTSIKGTARDVPQVPLPETRGPNERVHLDLFGPLQDPGKKKKYVCVITCAFTKIVRLAIVESKNAEEIAEAFVKEWIYLYGVPQSIVTDQGLEFCNVILTRVCELLKIDKITTTPYHPRSNAQVETFNKTMAAYFGP